MKKKAQGIYNPFEKVVKKGMALLDAQVPEWRDRVDLDTLDISKPYRCILGQVYADEMAISFTLNGYEIGLRALSCTDPIGHGYMFGDFNSVGELQQTWKELI